MKGNTLNIFLELFLTFAKIGAFTFGGGYAMVSLIEDTCVIKKKWITHEEMMNVLVVAESTPGPIAINSSTFVGYKVAGLKGALVSTFGMILPSFVIIYLISTFLENFMEIVWVANAFKGIKIGVGVLILNVGIKMVLKMKKTLFSYIVLFLAFASMLAINIFSLNISSILLLLISAVAGIVYVSLAKITGKEAQL